LGEQLLVKCEGVKRITCGFREAKPYGEDIRITSVDGQGGRKVPSGVIPPEAGKRFNTEGALGPEHG
jgi:hypothetical protein